MDKYDKEKWSDRRDLIARHRETLENNNEIDESALADLYVLVTYSEEEGWIEVTGWATQMQVEQAEWLRHPQYCSKGDGDDTPYLILINDDLKRFWECASEVAARDFG